jgi:glycosyltransferase involved in cell wall biosynthesis
MELSVIIPLYNEQDNILHLVSKLEQSLEGIDCEVIFVDDGSKDETVSRLLPHLSKKDSSIHMQLVILKRNYGQTSAMACGIEIAQGKYVVTLDGDLQNDPSDIPMMLAEIKSQNCDLIAGKRASRQDNILLRKLPSKIANFLIRNLSNVHIDDYGCTLKIFKAELAKSLDLYGELHRFIPILAQMQGAKISQVVVKHYPRIYGESKYGLGRTFKVMSDLLLMLFFQKYRQKPMHLFGNIGLSMFMLGGVIEAYLLLLKISGMSISNKPIFYIGILLIIMGIQFITTGFLAELMMRTYYNASARKPYEVKEIVK